MAKKKGRPTKYEEKDLEAAAEMSDEGFTDKEIARLYSVTVRTVNNWKKQYPEFSESLKRCKRRNDDRVKASLFRRATGYSHPEVHITTYQGAVTITQIVKHYPPSELAMMFWLCNRDPENWRRNGGERDGDEKINLVVVAQTELAKRMKEMK